MYLKSCPRCSGDLYTTYDTDGPLIDCIQCGYQTPVVTKKVRNPDERISIDRHIEILLALSRGRPLDTLEGNPVLIGMLEKRLSEMLQHEYVTTVGESNGQEGSKAGYELTPAGNNVVEAYREFVGRIGIPPKSVRGRSIVISYELVDEDGNLTVIGTYAIKASKILSEFVNAVRPMATISPDKSETVQEKSFE